MILSKADRLDGKEEVDGEYSTEKVDSIGYEPNHSEEASRSYINGNFILTSYGEIFEINPSTLKHSFNNGESWHTEDEIKEALEAKSKPRYKCDIETNGSYLLCNSCQEEYDEHEPK